MLEVDSFCMLYDCRATEFFSSAINEFQQTFGIKFQAVAVNFETPKMNIHLNESTRYLVVYDMSFMSDESCLSHFFKAFLPSKFKNQFATICSMIPENRQLIGLLLSALPIIHFKYPAKSIEFYGLRIAREDIQTESSVKVEARDEVETFVIHETSVEQFNDASAQSHRYLYQIPENVVDSKHVRLENTQCRFNFLMTKEWGFDRTKMVIRFKSRKDASNNAAPTSILDNPTYQPCNDLSQFITDISNLSEVSETIQDTFLEFLDGFLLWSRNHDATLFPGVVGRKRVMEMYLRLFEEFEQRIKNVPLHTPASRIFGIALKKTTPCIRSIKRQLLKLTDQEPTWLEASKSFSSFESRSSASNRSKKPKMTDLPGGVISMPLLEPYLDVVWPQYPNSEKPSSSLIDVYSEKNHEREQFILECKRIGE